eukprot:XP_011418536.1 PREDICTED: uncharacterized protein LOC105321782 [Crassostrea gigas]
MAAAKNGPSSSTEEQEANFDYQEVWENGRKQYECGSCHRYFTTMRSTLYHLHTMHGKSPLKKRRKQYLYDPEIEVPRSTPHYKKKKIILTDENINEFTKEETQDDDNEVKEEFEDIQTRELLHCDNPKLPHQNLQGVIL